MSKNISGVFKVKINGKERDLKCTFGVIEELEKNIYRRPVVAVLNEAIQGHIYTSEVVDTILEGLKGNRDTRFNREDIGQEILEKGIDEYVELFINFLTYAVSGDKSLEVSKSKKK